MATQKNRSAHTEPDPDTDLDTAADGLDDGTSQVRWAPATLVERGIVAVAVNVTGTYILWWGEGDAHTDTAAGAGPVRHTYAKAGSYTVIAKQGTTTLATAQVFVRDGLAPVVTFAPASDNSNIVEATFGDDPADLISRYEITWAAGAVETVVAPKGTVCSRGFQAGTHTIVIRDLHTGRSLSQDVEVKDKEYDPDFSVAKGADVNTALFTLTKVSGDGTQDVIIDFGDGATHTFTAAKPNDSISHTYARADSYIAQVAFTEGDTGNGGAKLITIPFPARTGRA